MSDTINLELLKSTIKSINGFDTLCLEKQIASEIEAGRVAFLTGAGISLGRSTFAPSWLEMMHAILAEISKITEDRCHSYTYNKTHFEPRLGMFFNEHVLQLLGEHLGLDAPEQVVTQALPKTHSSIHKFLVICAMLHGCPILTTNFDDLERAAFKEGQGKDGIMDDKKEDDFEKQILFLHGTGNQPGTLKIRTNQVFQSLLEDQKDKLKTMLNDRILIVLGYNGQDDFDVMPYLFDKNNGNCPKAIIWVVHNGCHNPNAAPILNEPDYTNDERLNFLHIADTDLFLQGVYRNMHEKICVSSWLSEKWIDSCSDDYKDFWKKGIATWGETWRRNKPDEMLKLWGAILEKMRLYNIQIGRCQRNLAIEAQQMIYKQSSCDLDKLAAEIKIVEMKRVSNLAAEKYFQQIETKLGELVIEPGSTASNLKRHLEREFAHQYGKWLQNQCRYDESADYLEKAIEIADKNGSPEKGSSQFQRFMMAWLARKKEHPEFFKAYLENDSKALNELFDALQKQADSFLHDDKDFENYANTMHNMAFVKQACGEESFQKSENALDKKMKHLDKAIENYACAEKMNVDGKQYRFRLRDPRRIAHSNVRIIECTLGRIEAYIALIALDGTQVRVDYLKELVSSVFGEANSPRSFIKLLKDVCKIYQGLPQEKMRYDDVVAAMDRAIKILSSDCKGLSDIDKRFVLSQIEDRIQELIRILEGAVSAKNSDSIIVLKSSLEAAINERDRLLKTCN